MNTYFTSSVGFPDKALYPLNYYVGQPKQQANSFLPRKEAITSLVMDHTYNLQMLACYAGKYVR